LKIQTRKFSVFANEPSARFDFNYVKSVPLENYNSYSYKELFEIVTPVTPVIDKEKSFKYAEINHVNKLGEVFPATLSYNSRTELNEDLFKKIEKGNIILPERGNILISTIRPYLNKNVLIEDNEKTDRDPVYFTKAFIQIKPKINSKILYYLIRTVLYEDINSVSRQGKGYPTLKDYDLKTIRFPKEIIDGLLANERKIVNEIEEIEKEINRVKLLRKSKSKIVDEIFAAEFKIDLKKVQEIDSESNLTVGLGSITLKNSNIRSSYRWNKMMMMQKYLYKDISCIESLGKYILRTNNGWSPESIEGGEGIPVLGQEHIEFDGVLNVSPIKATILTRNNISNFFVQKGDFFVSRGNTVNLVGIASIVEEEIDNDIIYPDLYIRVYFDDRVNPKYLALIFNSFFGRSYFKYVSKGKNQSMVKISKDELLSYYLPIPSISVQNELVLKVQNIVSIQKEQERNIEKRQNEIEEIIKNHMVG